MMDKLKRAEKLTCTTCGKVKEQYSSIVYSQGDRVCLDCKKKFSEADKMAFDRDMDCRALK